MSLLVAKGLKKAYAIPKKTGWFGNDQVSAVDGVDLQLEAGQTLGIVGESGSGKSTLGRLLLKLEVADQGSVSFDGKDLSGLGSSEMRKLRRQMQMVFQDPYASLDPRMKVRELVTENLVIHEGLKGREAIDEAARHLLGEVGLDRDVLERLPHEFSGGQRQRLAIARAIATRPKLLVADEPVSSLDVSIQAQVLDLLSGLRERLGMAMVFISHDLRVVRSLCDEVLVMKQGQVVERGPVAQVWDQPQHPYTRELLQSILPLPFKQGTR